MTIYGGQLTDGFFVVCTKCGWHSTVVIHADLNGNGFPIIHFECTKCHNKHTEEADA